MCGNIVSPTIIAAESDKSVEAAVVDSILELVPFLSLAVVGAALAASAAAAADLSRLSSSRRSSTSLLIVLLPPAPAAAAPPPPPNTVAWKSLGSILSLLVKTLFPFGSFGSSSLARYISLYTAALQLVQYHQINGNGNTSSLLISRNHTHAPNC